MSPRILDWLVAVDRQGDDRLAVRPGKAAKHKQSLMIGGDADLGSAVGHRRKGHPYAAGTGHLSERDG